MEVYITSVQIVQNYPKAPGASANITGVYISKKNVSSVINANGGLQTNHPVTHIIRGFMIEMLLSSVLNVAWNIRTDGL